MAKTHGSRPKKRAASPARPRQRRPTRKRIRAPSQSLDDFVTAAAFALALPLEPQWLAAVTANLEANLLFAAMVGEFPLPEESEPAPVFSA